MSKKSLIFRICIGLLIYWVFIQDGLEGTITEMNRKNWVTVPGKLIAVIVREEQHSERKKHINTFLQYSFSFKGMKKENTEMVSYNEIYPESTTIKELAEVKEQMYPPGSVVPVRVDPEINLNGTFTNGFCTVQPASGRAFFELFLGLSLELVLVIFTVRGLKKMRKT